jgi:hypothetical protein
MQGTIDLMNQVAHHFGWAHLPDILLAYWKVFVIMLLGYILHWLHGSLKDKGMNWFIATPVYLKVILTTLVVFLVYQAVSADLQPFIYFRF